ncbi:MULTISPECIES: ribose 5-phosphate isomerase B [Muribaculum]|jgi:ribose 5-phosphate isomerase B|uniref:Ribose 5-phosphate isomerase B n=1 Tax=Muribaculum caecicola TaxID=3038144 RepID=A0AC61S4L5_9BACT|nr:MULTISPECIES: ribose 5-phosphate isomerase B [Muribaculum]THG48664.1 ribose 5-phosphate isomerase B [Muribaculum caecicola]
MSLILKPGLPIGLCCDHAGYELKNIVEGYLQSQDINFTDFGCHSADSCDYPDYAHPCAQAIQDGKCYPAIGICGTGNGIAMALNKHKGIRAAICWNVELATLARTHNDANVLVLPARHIEPTVALAIVDAFLNTEFQGGRHQRRVEKIDMA